MNERLRGQTRFWLDLDLLIQVPNILPANQNLLQLDISKLQQNDQRKRI